jgi:hypothetical protein
MSERLNLMTLTTVNSFDSFIDAVPTADMDWYKVPYDEMALVNSDHVVRSDGSEVRNADYTYQSGTNGDNALKFNVQQIVDSPRKARPLTRVSLDVECGFTTSSDLTDMTSLRTGSAFIGFRTPSDAVPALSVAQISKLVQLAVGTMFNSCSAGVPSTAFIGQARAGLVTTLLGQTQT